MAFVLRQRLAKLNKRNAMLRMDREEVREKDAARKDASEEVPDTDPSYVFMT